MATFLKLIAEEPKFALRVMRVLTERIRRLGGALTQARS
jgi:CRP-like cAMP-binding protein